MRGFSATRRHRAPNARANWLVASEGLESRVLYGGMFKSGGYSLALLGRRFRANPPAAIHAHYGVVAAQHRHLARSLGRPLVASFYGYDAVEVSIRRHAPVVRSLPAPVPRCGRGPRRGSVHGRACRRARLPGGEAPHHSPAGRRSRPRRSRPAARRAHFSWSWPAGSWRRRASTRRPGVREGLPRARRAAPHGRRRRARGRVPASGAGRGDHGAGDDGSARSRSSSSCRRSRSASVAVFPSRPAPDGDTEGGAPVTLIETQWLGVPALVSEHDDLPFVTAPAGR